MINSVKEVETFEMLSDNVVLGTEGWEAWASSLFFSKDGNSSRSKAHLAR